MTKVDSNVLSEDSYNKMIKLIDPEEVKKLIFNPELKNLLIVADRLKNNNI